MGNTTHLQKSFAKRIEVSIIFLIISCLMVGVVAGVSRQYGGAEGTTDLVEGAAINGTTGQEIIKTSSISDSDVILLNEPPNFNNHWIDFSYHYPYSSWQSRVVRDTQSEGGLQLELEHAIAVYWTRVNIPLNVCSSIIFNASLTLLTGQVELTLDVEFEDYPWTDLEDLNLEQSITIAPSNNSGSIALDAPIEELHQRVSHFSVSSVLRLEIKSQFSSHLILGNVSVIGNTTQDLCRVAVDFQSLDGMSINSNPNSQWLSDKGFLSIERQGTNESSAVFTINRPNEIVYLLPGQYTGFAGWRSYYQGHSYSNVPVNLTLSANDTVTWNIRLHCTRIYINIRPKLPDVYISIRKESDYGQLFETHLNSTWSDHFYLPLPEDAIFLRIQINSNPPNLYSYRIIPFARDAEGEFDSSREWHVEVNLPMIMYSGFALRTEDAVLLVLGILILSLTIVRLIIHFEFIGFSKVLRDPRLFSIIWLITSVLLPWAEYSRISDWIVSESSVLITKISPLALFLTRSSGSDVIIESGIFWFYYLVGLVYFQNNACSMLLSSAMLFWIPTVYCLSRIGRIKKRRIDTRFALALVGPMLLVGVAFIPNSYVSFEGLGVGSYVALSALPIYILLNLLVLIRLRIKRTT